MSYRIRLTSGLALTLACAAAVVAQPPGRRGPGPGGPGFGPPGIAEERALDDLELTGERKDKAQRILDKNREATRRQFDKARADLLEQMKEVLTAEQFRQFRDAVDRRPPGPGAGRGVSADDLVERVMAFDKKKTGKVTKEDLPERMQHLVDMGDTNKDGALDREELKALAARLNREDRGPGRGPGGPGGPGRGPGGPGGPGRGPGGPGGPGGPFPPGALQQALDDLKLTGESKDKAQRLVDANRETTRKLLDQGRADLLAELKDVLTEAQFTQFKNALDRRPPGPGGRGPRPPF
jgi:Spy/CpxP family protein refolding chaperone